MPSSSLSSTLTTLSLFFLSTINAVSFDCGQVVVGELKLDLSPLSGPHSVFMLQQTPTGIKNTTFTLDICRPLVKSSDSKVKGCDNGARVCAFERFYRPDSPSEPLLDDLWAIAGEFLHKGRSGELNPQYTRLRGSGSHADADREGLRLELNGGEHAKVRQKAIVEFVCDHDKTGLEGLKPDTVGEKRRREEEGGDGNGEEEPALPDPNEGKSLQLRTYRVESTGGTGSASDEEVGVLRLEWFTKHACEGTTTGGGKKEEEKVPAGGKTSTRGWGGFTWFLVIVFLLIAAYLIFGSWLNYSRHGARGWDLLPHGDAIRDLPYLFKDWTRRVLNTVQGGGSGGRGYSAVG